MLAGCAAAAVLLLPGAAPAWGADAELAKLIEAARKEGEVHYIDAMVQPKSHAVLDRAFRRKYGLPESFKFTHTLRGTGEVVASVQQEIKADQHAIDVVWVAAPAFFKAAAKAGNFLPHASPEWKHYEGTVKRLGLEADPPQWITPVAYTFVPVWNRKCPGFANLQIKSYRDMLNPAFKGKMIVADVRRSFAYAATWVALEGSLGKEFFPKFVELTQPVIIFRSEESIQKVMTCEYPIQLMQRPAYVFQRMEEDPSLDLGLAWPEEGIAVLGTPMAILKGTKHPNAARLLIDFLLSPEGMHAYVSREANLSFREGFRTPDVVKKYVPDVEKLKALPVNWPALTLAEVTKVQNEFRRILRVD